MNGSEFWGVGGGGLGFFGGFYGLRFRGWGLGFATRYPVFRDEGLGFRGNSRILLQTEAPCSRSPLVD